MTVIIKKKYTYLLFILVPYIEFLKLRGEESDQGVFCYLSEVTFGKPQVHLRMGAGCQGDQPRDYRVGNFSPTL